MSILDPQGLLLKPLLGHDHVIIILFISISTIAIHLFIIFKVILKRCVNKYGYYLVLVKIDLTS